MALDFLATYTPLANEVATQTGLDPSVVLGIIDTETSGGTRVLGNNIFGISPGGKGGQYVAKYTDLEAGTEAFIKLMQQPRYAKVTAAADPVAQARALVAAGYNTVDPAYAKKVGGRALQYGQQLGYQDDAAAPGAAGGPDPAARPGEDDRMKLLEGLAPKPAAAAAPATAATTPAAPAARPGEDPRMAVLDQGAAEPPPPRTGIMGAYDAVVGAVTGPGERLAAAPADTRPDLSPAADAADLPASAQTLPDNVGHESPLSRIVGATVKGATEGGGFYTPEMHALVDQGLVGRYITNPLLDAAKGVAGGLGGAFGQAAYEAGNLVGGDKGGRDANALAMVLGAHAAMPGVIRPGGPPVTPGNIVRNTLKPWEEARTPVPSYEYNVEPFRTREGNIEAQLLALPPEVVAEMAKTNPNVAKWLADNPDVKTGTVEAKAAAERRQRFGDEPVPPETPAAEGPRPKLTPEDQRFMESTHRDVQELLAENQAEGIPGDLSAAATPEQLAKLTPAQMKAYRRQSELGQILSPPRQMDTNLYVEGSTPTRARWMGSADESPAERLLREKAPGTFEAQDNVNRQAQIKAYQDKAGSASEIPDLEEAKARAAERDGAAFEKAAKPLDLQPALTWVEEKLADPRIQENPDHMRTLREYRASLVDADGNLKTAPRAGWGMHDKLSTDLEKAKDITRDQRFSKKLTTEFKAIIDKVNDDASGGAFRTFLDNQASYAQQINAKKLLQEFEPSFTRRDGSINATAFHKFMINQAKRRARSGIDPAMDIPDETFQGLINLNEDLKRETNLDLGKARGSNTHMTFELAKALGIGGAHAVVNVMAMGNPIANLVLQGALKYTGETGANVLLRKRIKRAFEPPKGGFNQNALITSPNAPP